MMTCLVLTGLPGVGKSALAAALGPFVLHTDLLKVTLRHVGLDLHGPAWRDLDRKLELVHPVLQAHADKARRDGYPLIVEGTLATGFAPEGCRYVHLTLPEPQRLERIAHKPRSARDALADADLSALRHALVARAPAHAQRVDASASLAELVARFG